jgi:hypothetical protein
MIQLVREEVTVADAIADRHQWPVKFTATYTADNSPAKIFVMHLSPSAGVFQDTLSCVASAVQMTDLPEDAAEEGSPFYRVASVTTLCRSAAAAEEYVEKIKDAVQDLVNNLASAANLSVVETVTIAPNA